MLKKDNLRYEEKKHVANMLDIEYEIPYQPLLWKELFEVWILWKSAVIVQNQFGNHGD